MENQCEQALFTHVCEDSLRSSQPDRFRLFGLDSKKHYKVQLIWPYDEESSIVKALQVIAGHDFPGELLIENGIQLPLVPPETMLIFYVKETLDA